MAQTCCLAQSVFTPEFQGGAEATVPEKDMFRKAVLAVAISLAFPLLAFANNFSFGNSGGVITTSGNSLTLTGSNLISMNGFSGHLGGLSFTTGALKSGSFSGGGTFAAGGSFTLSGNGSQGLLFKGTFSSPVSWVAVWNAMGDGGRGDWTYKLSGVVTGTIISTGKTVSSRFVAYTLDVPNGAQFTSSVRFNDGNASVVTPEPATMALLGTGLVGIAAVGLRKRTKRG